MRACILTDFNLPSFARVGNLYTITFEKLGWRVEHLPLGSNTSGFSKRFDIVFHNVNGTNFRKIDGCNNIALFVHEWSHYPPAWTSYLDGFDALWTTTLHCKEIAERSGLKPPAYWLPPAMDLETPPEKSDYKAQSPFKFLYVGEWQFRKGLHLLFEAWDLAFPEPGEAHLTLKTSAGCPFDSPREDIEIVRTYWTQDQLHHAYITSDCYVSTSLGEGWGLPILEAIRCGLPVCANLWGGHGSMLSEDNCFAIPHKEIPQLYAPEPNLYAPGQTCAYSDPKETAKALRRALASDRAERKGLADAAFEKFQSAFTLKQFSEKPLNL